MEAVKKYVRLREWADSQFGDLAPKCDETLRRWARDGKIIPRPRKIGRDYAVHPGAKYINTNDPATLAEQF